MDLLSLPYLFPFLSYLLAPLPVVFKFAIRFRSYRWIYIKEPQHSNFLWAKNFRVHNCNLFKANIHYYYLIPVIQSTHINAFSAGLQKDQGGEGCFPGLAEDRRLEHSGITGFLPIPSLTALTSSHHFLCGSHVLKMNKYC